MQRLLPLAALVAVATGSAARAQQVTIQASAVTPIAVWNWTYWGTQQTSTLPAGPLPAAGSVEQLGGPWASVSWLTQSSASETSFGILSQRSSLQPSVMVAGTDAFEVVLDLSAPSARAIELVLERADASPNQAQPATVSIDIGNDGIVEYADLPTNGPITLSGLTAGPNPLQVSLAMSATSIGSFGTWGTASTDVLVRVRPDNDVTIVKEVDGCVPGQPGFDAPVPVFADAGVDLHFTPGLLIASAQSTPILWTPSSPLPFVGPCLIVPSPDILLWEPSGTLHVALPPEVRPGQLHLQVAFLTPTGVGASDGYQLLAH